MNTKTQNTQPSVLDVMVRITPVIANEYNDRAPDFVPEDCWIPGVYKVSLDCAKYMRIDAEDYASGLFFDNVRPGARRAYGAFAKQLDAAIGGAK